MQTTHSPRFPTLGLAILTVLAAGNAIAQLPAQVDELAVLRSQIAVLQQRLEKLESAPGGQSANDTATLQVNRQGLVAKHKDNFTFRIRPRIQIDGRWFADDEDGNSEFTVRRLRPIFQGTAGPVAWRFMPELAGTVRVLDAWGDLSLGSHHYLRAGKFKQPVGLERLQSFSKTLFLERGLPSLLTPTRDIGVALYGSDPAERFNWTVGLFNGVLDDTDLSSNANLSGGDFDVGARLEFTPWKSATDSALAGLSFGLATSIGRENTSILDSESDRRIRYRTSGRGTFFRYNDGVRVDGDRIRINPFLSYYHGPFGLLAEYVQSSYELTRSDNAQTIDTDAWTLQMGWVLTGEKASFSGVRPSRPFKWGSGQIGAWELGLRAHALQVDDAAFAGDASTRLARSNAVQEAFAWGIALNWYLTDNLLIATNFEITDFSGLGLNRPTEEVVITRFQVDF